MDESEERKNSPLTPVVGAKNKRDVLQRDNYNQRPDDQRQNSEDILLRRLDSDGEVRKFGRSAVLRRAAADYLKRSRSKRIADAYRRAYRGGDGLGSEFAGWEGEGSWPGK